MAGLAHAVKNARRRAAGGDKGNWTFSGAAEKAKELAPKLQRNTAKSAFQNAARSATQRDQQRTFPRPQNRK